MSLWESAVEVVLEEPLQRVDPCLIRFTFVTLLIEFVTHNFVDLGKIGLMRVDLVRVDFEKVDLERLNLLLMTFSFFPYT